MGASRSAASFQLPASGFSLPAASFQLPAFRFQLSAFRFLSFPSSYELPASSLRGWLAASGPSMGGTGVRWSEFGHQAAEHSPDLLQLAGQPTVTGWFQEPQVAGEKEIILNFIERPQGVQEKSMEIGI
jgi:hypothetical protein